MQRNGTRKLSRIAGLLALRALVAIPVLAQPPLNPGTVLLSTPAGAGTAVDFSSNPIPAGFFCPGSAPFGGVIPLQGVPLVTNPPGIAGSADTLIEHGMGAFGGGVASFAAILRAMHLVSSGTITIVCGDGTTTTWRLEVCACGQQTATKVTAKIDPACGTCGVADGTLSVRACVRFIEVNTGRTLGPIAQNILLNLAGTPWCFRPGLGETVANQPFAVDTNCDNQPDLSVRPSTNFHTGYTCATEGADCHTIFASLTHCHENPGGDHEHCINPVCDKRQ